MTEATGSIEAPSMGRRRFISLMTGGSVAAVAMGAAYPFVSYFIPASTGSGSSGVVAADAQGKPVSVSNLLATRLSTDRVLAQGLKGDPTYVVINESAIADYGINAICTHLGCVVPWVAAENKFKCPCHGSQYASNGKVVRGPAPASLALARASVDGDTITFSPWNDDDFRDA
ncbi:MAG: cytochrome b6-f complex iron-sulfur subunit [Cyanobacteria bacterium P01_F01_bin.33]